MRTIITGVVCLLASSLSAFDLIDTVQSLRQKAWESEFIPESTVPVVPLTDYDEFEVVELFRAETIEQLEFSITDGYPFAWLEETLRDETIPWEDRYWLDRRVRAAISQNLHAFFDTEGNTVHLDADGIFPGEFYWREHMIADPSGWNVPEGTSRPIGLERWDIGHIYDPYGYRVGDIALPISSLLSLSRDASIGVISSGGNGIYHPFNQPYACLMYPDGSFKEIPLDSIGSYDALVSPDGEVIAFFCVRRDNLPSEERATSIVPIYLFDRDGNSQGTITPPVPLSWSYRAAISPDGNYVCHVARGANTCLIDCFERTARILPKPEQYDSYTSEFIFSPDGKYLCIGGSTTGRIMDLERDSEITFSETLPGEDDYRTRTHVCCSNDLICTTLGIRREYRPQFNYHFDLFAYIGDKQIWSDTINIQGITFPFQIDVSPSGYYLIINPPQAAHGAPSEVAGPHDMYNLPFVALRIEGR